MALPRILQFKNDDVIEFLFADGTITTTPLGGGYSFDPRGGFYNLADDMIYVGNFGGSTVIRYNPRTNAIVGTADLSAYGSIWDVQDQHIWIPSSPDLYAVSVVDFSLVFTGTNAITGWGGTGMGATGGRIIGIDGVDPELLHVLTITSPTTWTDDTVTLPALNGGSYYFAEDGGFQRPCIFNGDKMWVSAFNDVDIVGAIVDLTNLTAVPVAQPSVSRFSNVQGGRWDAHNDAMVLKADDNTDSLTCGLIVDVATAAVLGTIGKDVLMDFTGFYDEPRPLGDGIAVMFNPNQHAGFFDEAAPTVDPLSIVGGVDYLFNDFDGFVIVPPPPGSFFWQNFVRTREVLTE